MDQLRAWKEKNEKQAILIHSASLGEFEHIRPLLYYIKKNTDYKIVVTFFSPSGYDNCKDKNVDLKLFLPIDFPSNWKRFYSILKPEFVVISKYDVWPNQINIAKSMDIPIYLINASLSSHSHKTGIFTRKFFKPLYKKFAAIFAITERDAKLIKDIFECQNVEVMGDTKFDQVLVRKENALKNNLIKEEWIRDQRILVFGSIWPEDAEIVLKDIEEILQNYENLKIILVPHQPTKEIIKKLVQYLSSFNICYYLQNQFEGRVLIIDTVGMLAEIYKYADYAYIGGSFKQGIHNVMEAAVYGIPVIHGPKYLNSAEAIGLLENKGSFVVNTTEEFKAIFKKCYADDSYSERVGKNGQKFSLSNTGSTEKILSYLKLK